MGEGGKDALRVDFDGRLKLEFHGSKVTSDAAREAHQDWSEDSYTCSLCDFPNG